MISPNNLKKKIAKTRAELDEEYYQLGKNVFESTDKANIKISTLIDQLIDYRIKLHDIKYVMNCSICGAENSHDNHYCQNCGKEINEKSKS